MQRGPNLRIHGLSLAGRGRPIGGAVQHFPEAWGYLHMCLFRVPALFFGPAFRQHALPRQYQALRTLQVLGVPAAGRHHLVLVPIPWWCLTSIKSGR